MRESLPADAGAVVPPEDPAALAAALGARLADPAAADLEGQRGRAHVVAAHDLRQTVEQTVAAYREVLA